MGRPRHRVRFWAMAAGSALFTLLGLVLIAVGPTAENRRVGVMSVLLFGLGPASYLGGPLLTRRGRGEIRVGRAGSEPAFVFPTPPTKTALQLISAIGLAGGALLLYLDAGGWVLAACLIVFGLFLLLALYRTVRPQRLVLTPTRVVIGSTRIPWEGSRTSTSTRCRPGARRSTWLESTRAGAVLRHYRADAAERRRIGDAEELARLHRLPSLAGRT